MKLAASINVREDLAYMMDKDELKHYVLNALTNEISKEISKHMTVTSTPNMMDHSTTYVGTVTVGSVGASTISGYNGTTSSGSAYSQINLRVVEYTKNGKVTRVELQKYDESSDDWFRIPRIQIEE